ncbi:hypothetical protein IJJ39_01610 [Candidatus Saccharibacteria bacterium]|nr:hypothetical protein [Candidatus Saccharibacteria bacterium]
MEYPKEYLSHLKSLLEQYPTFGEMIGLSHPRFGPNWQFRDSETATHLGHLFSPEATRRQSRSFNRTAVSLITKYCIMHQSDENYKFLSAPQPYQDRMSKKTYEDLGRTMDSLRLHPDSSELLDLYLIIRGYATTSEAREKVYAATGHEMSTVFPIATAQELIEKSLIKELDSIELGPHNVLRYASEADLPLLEVFDGEAPPNLDQAFTDEYDDLITQFILATNLFEIAGRAGHISQQGSATLTEAVARDYLRFFELSIRSAPIYDFYTDDTKSLLSRKLSPSRTEAMASVRLARMMGDMTLASRISDILIQAYPKYDYFIHEMSLGSPWNNQGMQPIALIAAWGYLSTVYRANVKKNCADPVRQTIEDELPNVIAKMRSLRRTSLLNPTKNDVLYLDLTSDLRRIKRTLAEQK